MRHFTVKKILEINPDHVLIQELLKRVEINPDKDTEDIAKIIY